ncbi:MAG: hydrolase, partial [Gaiellales bacterium]
MDLLHTLTRLPIPTVARCAVPKDLEAVATFGEQAAARDLDLDPVAVEQVWRTTEAIYRTGVHPG